jgi:hypothetical protein
MLYELELDEQGWTSVDALVEALSPELRWRELSRAQLGGMVYAPDPDQMLGYTAAGGISAFVTDFLVIPNRPTAVG